jgi:hypothetical protein
MEVSETDEVPEIKVEERDEGGKDRSGSANI